MSESDLLTYGRAMPQSIEMERAVLCALLVDRKGMLQVTSFLKPEVFYSDIHQEIFKAFEALFSEFQPIDLLTVSNWLQEKGKLEMIGGHVYLLDLTKVVANSAHLAYHARIVLLKSIQREMIFETTTLLKSAYDDGLSLEEALERNWEVLYRLKVQFNSLDKDHSREAIAKAVVANVKEQKDGKHPKLQLVGIQDIVPFCQLKEGMLMIIGARPGVGKSIFAITVAKFVGVDQGKHVALWSLEMSRVDVANRLFACMSGVEFTKFDFGTIDLNRLDSVVENFKKSGINIIEEYDVTVAKIEAKIAELKQREELDLLIIDYGGLINHYRERGQSDSAAIGNTSRRLKQIALTYNIRILMLWQLNRGADSVHAPALSSLRDSGSLEQDADIVCFLHRPQMHNENVDHDHVMDTEFYCRKFRNGSLGKAKIRMNPTLMRFEDPYPELRGEFYNPSDDYDDEPDWITEGHDN